MLLGIVAFAYLQSLDMWRSEGEIRCVFSEPCVALLTSVFVISSWLMVQDPNQILGR
jgi:hypothetical protein